MVANVEGKTMKRSLTPMDRAMVIKASEKFYSAKEKNDYRGMIRLEKIRDRLDVEGLIDWQDEQRDVARTAALEWNRKEEASPGSGGKVPRLDRREMMGSPSDVIIPLSMDAVIRDALKAMEWDAETAYFAAHACRAFGLDLDDSDFDLPKEALDA